MLKTVAYAQDRRLMPNITLLTRWQVLDRQKKARMVLDRTHEQARKHLEATFRLEVRGRRHARQLGPTGDHERE
jgi:hypothetical protein